MRSKALPATLAIVFVIAVATPVLAMATAQSAGSATAQASPSPHGSANSHAADNADRGMNREGSPGEWKGDGHQPSEGSFPQGHSPSDPDGMGNGGMDKPGMDGGFDDDQDGNNGCGNDADREDDNNGWCGKPAFAGRTSPSPSASPEVSPTESETPTPAVVAGRTQARVLGVQLHRTLGSGALATTGAHIVEVLLVAAGFMLAGAVMRRLRRAA
jgi:hypothetical protein